MCGKKKDNNSLTAPIQIVLALASDATLNHTLYLRAFLLVFFRLCRSTVGFSSPTYIHMHLSITRAGELALVEIIEICMYIVKRNRIERTLPCMIRSASV